MNKRKIFGFLTLMFGLMLVSSCNKMNSSEQPETKVTVSTELYYLNDNGELSPINNLRAVTGETSKGEVKGDGVYDYNAKVTLTVTPNDSYMLYKFYEKDGKGGFTEAKGVVNKKGTHEVIFNVLSDMKFIAVFSSGGSGDDEVLGYQNLKLNGNPSDLSEIVDGKEQSTGKITAIGEEVLALKDPTGNLTGIWEVRNDAYKAWQVQNPSEAWLKPSIDTATGIVTYTIEPFNEKSPARTATFKVGKNGTKPELNKNAWRTVTITQNSYYVGTDKSEEDVTNPADDQFVYGDGTIADIKAALETSMKPEGETKDFSTLDKTLSNKVYMLVPVYINGEKQPKEKWEKRELTLQWGTPADTWLTKEQGSNYSAKINNSKAKLQTTVDAEFMLGDLVVKTTKITVTQDKKQYSVDVEII